MIRDEQTARLQGDRVANDHDPLMGNNQTSRSQEIKPDGILSEWDHMGLLGSMAIRIETPTPLYPRKASPRHGARPKCTSGRQRPSPGECTANARAGDRQRNTRCAALYALMRQGAHSAPSGGWQRLVRGEVREKLSRASSLRLWSIGKANQQLGGRKQQRRRATG